jgi:cation diffusion facilitator family transporter
LTTDARDLDRESVSGQGRTALASIVAAGVLVALKLGTGLLTGSLALTSAGIESSGDVIAAILTFAAIKLGGRPADAEHPYGHRRAENLAALAEAAIIAAGGLIVTFEAVRQLLGHSVEPLQARWYIFVVIGAALAIDASRILVSVAAARRYNSAAFRSNAFNFAGDLAGSVAVLVGLALYSAGVKQGDAIAALFVACLIFYAVFRLIRENASVLMDRTPLDAQRRASEAIEELGSEVEMRRLRVRESGGRYFADVVVGVSPAQAIVEGHATADRVEDAVERALPGSDVVVHLEPRRRGVDLRDRVLAAALGEPLVREAHDIAIFEHGDEATVSLHLKFPDDLSLAEAHAAAERAEAAIAGLPGVDAVQSHLEPLERPVPTRPVPDAAARQLAARLEQLITDTAGGPPREIRILATDVGPVVFVTVAMDDDATLAAAHAWASELEETLRAAEPGLVEVVVHTEPR